MRISTLISISVLAALLAGGTPQATADPFGARLTAAAPEPTAEALDQAAFDRLTLRARRALGTNFGCLRTSVNDLSSLDLVVTRRRALPAARRLRARLRAEVDGHLHEASRPYNHIASIEVAPARYRYATMRTIFAQARTALAPYPPASVLFESVPYFAGATRGHCAPVIARIPGGEPAAAAQAARALQTRFGADRVEIREATAEAFPV